MPNQSMCASFQTFLRVGNEADFSAAPAAGDKDFSANIRRSIFKLPYQGFGNGALSAAPCRIEQKKYSRRSRSARQFSGNNSPNRVRKYERSCQQAINYFIREHYPT